MLNKIRSMFARAAQTGFDGEFETAYEMATRLMRKYSVSDWDVCFNGLRDATTEADYVLNNFRTAKARWDAMDQERVKQEAKQAEPKKDTKAETGKEQASAEDGYRLVWVNGHKRTSKNGTEHEVKGHYRKVKIGAKA